MCDDQLVNLLQIFQVFFQIFGVFVRNSMLKPFFVKLNLIWTKLHCIRTCIMTFTLFMHHIAFILYHFCANLQSALGFVFFFFLLPVCFGPYPSTMPRKTRANRILLWNFKILASVRTVPKYSRTRTRSNPQGLEWT